MRHFDQKNGRIAYWVGDFFITVHQYAGELVKRVWVSFDGMKAGHSFRGVVDDFGNIVEV